MHTADIAEAQFVILMGAEYSRPSSCALPNLHALYAHL